MSQKKRLAVAVGEPSRGDENELRVSKSKSDRPTCDTDDSDRPSPVTDTDRPSDCSTNSPSVKKKKSDNASADSLYSTYNYMDMDVTKYLKGSTVSGELLFCGGTDWDLVGRSALPVGIKTSSGRNLWEPHRLSCMKGIQVRSVVSGCGACYSMVITTNGQAYSWGRNDRGQLGHGDKLRRDDPTLIATLVGINIVDAACGRGHMLLLSEKGNVYACGDNRNGQLGLGMKIAYVASPTQIQYQGPPIRRIACGTDFSMIVNVLGHLFSFGCPECGQLGHNTDGKYIAGRTIMYHCELRPHRVILFVELTPNGHILPVEDVNVQDVACGSKHTIVLDSKKRVFTFGFGGYGRLGHAEQKDELMPRLLKSFVGRTRGATMIAAGTAFSMATNEIGLLFLWGQIKPSYGEAAMYPKPVRDLQGWTIRSVGCGNQSVVVAADNSVISWGPSPTYGELGYGPDGPKSSTRPREMGPLKGIHVHQVACGYGHTLMIARCDNDEEKEALDEIPEYKPGQN